MPIKSIDFYSNIELKISNINYIMYRSYEPGLNIRIAGGVQSSMFYVEKGPVTLLVEGKKYTLNSGELFCKDVWQQIEVINESTEKISYYVITFHFEKGYSFEKYELDRKFIPTQPELFEELFLKLHRYYNERDVACKIKEKSILYEILYKIIRLHFSFEITSKNEIKTALAVRYINQNISQKITLQQLSDITNYSIPHLRRLFYETFGISPLNYITEQRIKRAKEIIEIEDLPISQVADLCGFENTSYFIKQFKNSTGTTPKEYRSNFFK